jgi:hypothetical protein
MVPMIVQKKKKNGSYKFPKNCKVVPIIFQSLQTGFLF